MRYVELRAAMTAIDDEFARLRLMRAEDTAPAWKSANERWNALKESVRRRYRASARGTIRMDYLSSRHTPVVYLAVRDETRLQESSARVEPITGEIDIGIARVRPDEAAKAREIRLLVDRWVAGEIDELPPSDTDGTHPWTEPGYEPEPWR